MSDIGISISLINNYDVGISNLEKQATEFKKAKDWNSAIECLKKARELRGYSTDRLPLFLQQAGLFNEAMTEFKRLLDEVDPYCASMFSHQPKTIQRGQSYHMRASIYNKMRLACEREKLLEEASKYALSSDKYSLKFREYSDRRAALRAKKYSK